MSIDYYSDPVGHCIEAFQSGDADVRYHAADILRGLGTDALPALDVICEHLESDTDIEVRRQCAFALIDIGGCLKSKADACLPYLKTAMNNSDDEIAELAKLAIDAITN